MLGLAALAPSPPSSVPVAARVAATAQQTIAVLPVAPKDRGP
jgi:hypothetical protein